MIKTAAPFVEEMFNRIWRRRPDNPTKEELFDVPIQAAIDMLQRFTGITHEDLAKRVFLTVPQLTLITLRGTPMRAEIAERLTKIASEFGAADLVAYFDNKATVLRRNSRKPRAPK